MELKCDPFWRQAFVVTGVILNSLAYGFVNTFISVLLPQLRSSKAIVLDMDQESWIVTIASIGNLAGILMVPIIMDKHGRRITNLISITLMAIGWLCISIVSEYYWLLMIRFLQGISVGMMLILGPMLVGEYASPKYRGAFLSFYPFTIGTGVFLIHSLGSFLSWWTISVMCGIIAILNMVIVLLSPESPSFLVFHGRYEDSRVAFHWLRGLGEDEELEKMVKAYIFRRSECKRSSLMIHKRLTSVIEVIKKKEVYKPLILMFHLAIVAQWSARNVLDVYTLEVFDRIVDKSMNMPAVILSTDIQRLVTNFIAIFVIRYVKRRVMVLRSISMNLVAFILIASYAYTRDHGLLPFDHPAIGVLLMHLHVFTMAMGNSPLPTVILGEIFPLEYRSICSMLVLLFYILNDIINMKTVLTVFSLTGLASAYCVYAVLVGYGLVVTMILLPETKDKCLQDIEEEFRGDPIIHMTEAAVLFDQEKRYS